MRSTQEEKAKARELAAKGHTAGMIAYQLGRSRNTIYRWLNPEKVKVYDQRKREYRRKNLERERRENRKRARRQRKSICPVCRRPAKGANVKRCGRCLKEDREWFWNELETLWNDGLTVKEIAAKVNRSWWSVQGYLRRMREAGRNVPLRRPSKAGLDLSSASAPKEHSPANL